MRVKSTYPKDVVICTRLLKRGMGQLSGAAARAAATAEMQSMKNGESHWSTVLPERRAVIAGSLSPEALMSYRKDALGKYLNKTPMKTYEDILVDSKEKIVVERQLGGEEPQGLVDDIARMEALMRDCPEAATHVYKSAKGERVYLNNLTQTPSLAHVCSSALDLDNAYARNIVATEVEPDAASSQIRVVKVSKAAKGLRGAAAMSSRSRRPGRKQRKNRIAASPGTFTRSS